jgi:hypothetical protein
LAQPSTAQSHRIEAGMVPLRSMFRVVAPPLLTRRSHVIQTLPAYFDRWPFGLDFIHAIDDELAKASMPESSICYDSGHDRGLCQFVIDGMDEVEPEGPTVEVRWQRLDDMASACERWWKDHPEHRSQRHHARSDAMALRGAYLIQRGCES